MSGSWDPTKFDFAAHETPQAQGPSGWASATTADRQAEKYVDLIRRFAAGDLLDVGCGESPIYELYGPRSVSVTRTDYLMPGNGLVDCISDASNGLPFRDGSFDTVLATDVIEHLPDPVSFLRDVYRVLRPGGTALITSPFLYPLHERPRDFWRPSEFWYRLHAEQMAWELAYLQPYGGAPDVMADLCAKHLVRSNLMVRVFNRIARPLLRSAWATRWRAKTESRFPLGYAVGLRRPV